MAPFTNLNERSFVTAVYRNVEHQRMNRGLLASVERKTLIWLANRIPGAIKSDHLTALGFVSLICVGLSYWYSRYSSTGLILGMVFLVLNWFGDSLDGTLARVRNQQRPRYGFYIDHILDALGSVFLFTGLALSGYMSERVAIGLAVVYLLLSIETYLTTYSLGEFHLSFAAFGPTELRLLLIAGNIALIYTGSRQLFDIGGVIGIVGMTMALIWSVVKHAARLHRSETPANPRSHKFREMLVRWGKFNAVGVAGFVLQLAMLWVLTRYAGVQYLLATAVAVEISLLHNFVWHEVWTWKGLAVEDRWRRLVRFHVANGFLSIASNVLFTWLLMQSGLPLLVANTAAVAVTALLNFALAVRWVFQDAEATARSGQ